MACTCGDCADCCRADYEATLAPKEAMAEPEEAVVEGQSSAPQEEKPAEKVEPPKGMELDIYKTLMLLAQKGKHSAQVEAIYKVGAYNTLIQLELLRCVDQLARATVALANIEATKLQMKQQQGNVVVPLPGPVKVR